MSEQLKMYHLMEEFDDFPVPEGWTLRTWRPGDELTWTEICENGLNAPDDGTLRDWRKSKRLVLTLLSCTTETSLWICSRIPA